MEFFHAPNHRNMTFSPFSRARIIVSSMSEKSYCRSMGSRRSHCAGTRTVFMPMAFMRGITAAMSSRHVAAELLSSPARMSMGLPSISICALVPRLTRLTWAFMANGKTARRAASRKVRLIACVWFRVNNKSDIIIPHTAAVCLLAARRDVGDGVILFVSR